MKWPASCQAADRLDGARVGLGAEDLRLGVGLLDGGRELLGLEAVDLPHDLLRVGDRDAEAALGDLLEQVPVVVQGRVDVDGDAHRTSGYGRSAMPESRPVKSLGGLLHPGPDHDYGRRGRAEWLDVDWQRHQHRIRIDGREANYVDLGEGPALVFVHGLGASWQSWLENLPEFARDHRVVAMDLPGLRLLGDARRGHLDRVLRALDASRCSTRSGSTSAAVVGNSMGGFIAAEMAIRSPERVQRLTVVSRRRVLAGLPARAAAGRARAAVRRLRGARAGALDRRRSPRGRGCARGRSPPPASATRT